ncbi:Endoglucanase-1 [Dactylella cylindrospora]|nr:Endoglucanase-1 [Dactylella cylindrospora]
MKQVTAVAAFALAAAGLASAQSGAWGQCGGINWTGPTTCVSGYVCTYSNDWYSQCIPGTGGGTTTTSRTTSRTTTTSSRTTSRTTTRTTTTSSRTTTAPVTPSSSDFCGQWDLRETDAFILYNNLWGMGSATSGSQCTGLDYASGNTIRWHTSWSWQGGQYNVKSYANANLKFTPRRLSAVSSIPTTLQFSYTGTSGMVANVAYDMFTASTSGSNTPEYEIMVWVGAYGGAGPISSTGSTIATIAIDGVSWNLYKGPNGQMTVFSFVATNAPVTNWSGDLNNFIKYLTSSQGLPNTQYLNTIQTGTEPFVGTNARFTVTNYSVVIN